MLKRRMLVVTGAVTLALGAGLGAAVRQDQSTQAPAAATESSSSKTTVHLEGCVFPKDALSGSGPIRVPVGAVEDYVLTDTKVISRAEGTDVPTGMFQLMEVPQPRLRALIDQRVGVTGHIEADPELPRLVVTGIREISGSCPARPSMHS